MILNTKRSSHWLDGACSLQPVYAKKYVKWKQKGVLCVDVRLLVLLRWRVVSWLWRGRSRNAYQSLPADEKFSSVFTCFALLGVFVRNGVVWRIHFILFLLLLLLCISHGPITVIFPKIWYISRLHRYAKHKYCFLLSMYLGLCLLDTTLSHTKTDKLIKMPFGLC